MTMVKIRIDGTFYEVSADNNLLYTCMALGFDIPYFCFHPALGSVGACRLCAVKKFTNADDKKGRIVMSCMEQVTDGMIISVNDPEVRKFRAAVIESLMTNHPHDCPVCDEGGECHLQDMTVMTGHNYRRFSYKKRTYFNQNLGPFINHEMNRCIQCYRCVRLYRDYSGGKDLNVFGSANHVYFGRQKDGILENEFSGNLVEVCPTGVFTDKTLKKHYTRKWDMTNAPSVCVHCSLGCNILISERYGSVRRIMSRYNGSVNGYLLCDRGRFGYEFINNPERIENVKIRPSKESGLVDIKDNISIPEIIESVSSRKIIGIGSPRASLEANFALLTLVGKENFFHGISQDEQKLTGKAVQILKSGIALLPSLKQTEKCDAVFILGEDVTNTAPMLALALRQAVRNKSVRIAAKIRIPEWSDAAVREMDQNSKSPLFIASAFSTKLDDVAEKTFHAAPADIARLGFLTASLIHSGAPVVPDPDKPALALAQRITDALTSAENPLIVAGICSGSDDILNAAVNIAVALSRIGKKPSLTITFPECNSVGLSMIEGNSFDDVIEVIEKKNAKTLIILENDLYRRASKEKIDNFLEKCQQVIVLDHLMNETAKKADIVLPVCTCAESAGTIVSNEGRAQRYYRVLPETGHVKESWRWINNFMKLSEETKSVSWEKLDDVFASLTNSHPEFSLLKEYIPDADFRFYNEKIARQTLRFSGRTAINSNISVNEPKPPQDPDLPLNFSMEGYKGYPPSSLIPYYWSPGWNSLQAMNKYMDEPDGPLKEGDPGIRLFGKTNNSNTDYSENVPGPFRTKPGELFIVPLYLIYGSEELSSKGEAIPVLIPEPFILLNRKESDKLNMVDNEIFKLIINQVIINIKVKTGDHLPDGVAGLSFLLPGMPYIALPDWGKLEKNGID